MRRRWTSRPWTRRAPPDPLLSRVLIAIGGDPPHHARPLLARLVATGATREEAIARTAVALDAFVVEGVGTVIPIHQYVMQSAAFRASSVHTQMVEQGAFNG